MSEGDLGRLGWKLVIDTSELLPTLRSAMAEAQAEIAARGLKAPISATGGAGAGPTTFAGAQAGIPGVGVPLASAGGFAPNVPSVHSLITGAGVSPPYIRGADAAAVVMRSYERQSAISGAASNAVTFLQSMNPDGYTALTQRMAENAIGGALREGENVSRRVDRSFDLANLADQKIRERNEMRLNRDMDRASARRQAVASGYESAERQYDLAHPSNDIDPSSGSGRTFRPDFGPPGAGGGGSGGGLPFGMQMGKGFLNFKAGVRMGMFQTIFGMWEASQARAAVDAGMIQAAMAGTPTEKLQAEVGALQKATAGPMSSMLSMMGDLVGVGPAGVIRSGQSTISIMTAIEQKEAFQRESSRASSMGRLIRAGGSDYEMAMRKITGERDEQRTLLGARVKFSQDQIDRYKEVESYTSHSNPFYSGPKLTPNYRGTDEQIRQAETSRDLSKSALDASETKSAAAMDLLNRQRDDEAKGNLQTRRLQDYANSTERRIAIAVAGTPVGSQSRALAEVEAARQQALGYGAGVFKMNVFDPFGGKGAKERGEINAVYNAQRNDIIASTAEREGLARSVAFDQHYAISRTNPGTYQRETEMIRAERDSELSKHDVQFKGRMGGTAEILDKYDISQRYEDRLRDAGIVHSQQFGMQAMGLSGEASVFRAIIGNADPTTVRAMGMANAGAMRSTQYQNQLEYGLARQASEASALGLTALKQEYLRGFKGQQIDLSSTDVSNPNDRANPVEVLREINRNIEAFMVDVKNLVSN